MKNKLSIFLLVISFSIHSYAQEKIDNVSLKTQLDLKMVDGPSISPDGNYILYSERTTDWKNNRYDREIWLSKKGGSPIQFTNTENGSSFNAKFSPNSKWISFLAKRDNKTKLFIISVLGGEARCITDIDKIKNYKWAPDGTKIGFIIGDKETKIEEKETKKYGKFVVIDALKTTDYSQIWVLDFYDDIDSLQTCQQPKKITNHKYAITNFFWHPIKNEIVYNYQPKASYENQIKSNIAVLNLTTNSTDYIISNKSNDEAMGYSQNGNELVYSTFLDDTTSTFFANNSMYIYNFVNKKNREILGDFDENKWFTDWNSKGMYFWAFIKTKRHLFKVDVESNTYEHVILPQEVISNVSFSSDASEFTYTGQKYNELAEIIYVGYKSEKANTKTVTNSNSQLDRWLVPISEVISWKSKDHQTIEGILTKPVNFDSKKKYPLLVILHGGPTSVDIPEPVYEEMYPSLQWALEGSLILRVNYRGSRGYGEKFRSLNVQNFGEGDTWDVVSGIEYLDGLGYVDMNKLGCMGWSQGGYISAYLTTNTSIFKAISVGAGISNWTTYYNNTDITSFTRQYLKSTPQQNPEIYKVTSPISNILKANTPTLIQHGEFDNRVPVANAFELYRGLQDNNVESKLILYKGFRHWIGKPRERMAAMKHNYDWFNTYLFNN